MLEYQAHVRTRTLTRTQSCERNTRYACTNNMMKMIIKHEYYYRSLQNRSGHGLTGRSGCYGHAGN